MGNDMRHCVLTLVERKTGYAIIKKLKARTMDEVTHAASAPSAVTAERFETITLDNGTEFHDYARLEQRFPQDLLRHALSLVGARQQRELQRPAPSYLPKAPA